MDLPNPGEWPCQQSPRDDLSPKLVALLYRLLRDGHVAPGDLEQVCLDIRTTTEMPDFTNPHLEGYARAIATFVT